MKPEQVQQLTKNILALLQRVAIDVPQLIKHCEEVCAADDNLQKANKSLTEQVVSLQKRLEEMEGTEEFKKARLARHEAEAKKHRDLLAVHESEIEKMKK